MTINKCQWSKLTVDFSAEAAAIGYPSYQYLNIKVTKQNKHTLYMKTIYCKGRKLYTTWAVVCGSVAEGS